jgi:hypothetical protein
LDIKPCQLWRKAQCFRDHLHLHHQGNDADDDLCNVGLLSTTDKACCLRRFYRVQLLWKLQFLHISTVNLLPHSVSHLCSRRKSALQSLTVNSLRLQILAIDHVTSSELPLQSSSLFYCESVTWPVKGNCKFFCDCGLCYLISKVFNLN